MTIPIRAEIPNRFTWDLSDLFPSDIEWETAYSQLESRLGAITSFQGRLKESTAILLEALECYLGTLRELERVYTFSHLRSDEDTSNSGNLGRLDRATGLFTRFSALASFLVPEILSLPDDVIASRINAKELAPYKRMLTEIVRYKPHTLSESEEALLAEGSEVLGASERIFSQLNNADLTFGTIEENGQKKTLSHGSFLSFLKSPKREIRKLAYEQYYASFAAHQYTIAQTLTSSLKRDAFFARVRRYPSALERALFSENVPKAVYTNLIATASEFLPALHKYYELRAKILELTPLELYDTHVPLVSEVKTHIPFDEAVELVVEACRPLGDEYCEILHRGLTTERWCDVYENKGKRSGAYSSGCFDSAPYLLMNYKEDSLHDLFTLAHEVGHSMHSYFSKKTQLYQDYEYSIFVAEVASTLNEQLLLHFLRKKHAGDKKMLAYLINQQLDEIKSTLYRQTMFAEFELNTHTKIEAHEALTVDTYREMYTPLLTKYFGNAVRIEDGAWLECLRIPHFYSAFYVYKYATGIAAAISLAEDLLTKKEGAHQRYIGFLKAGGSKYPLEVLKDAGVDMTSPEPIRRALTLFGKLTGDLEAALS